MGKRRRRRRRRQLITDTPPPHPHPQQHYLSYLNSLRVQDVFLSAHSLLHYFDRLILSASDTKSDGDDGYGRSLRYAALNLASLHCHFGH